MIHKDELRAAIATSAASIESRMIAWRRDFHEHPELGNQEHRTAAIVAAHLKRLGLDVRTDVAGTGIVAVLDGKARGPAVALRADMDALPVKEVVAVPFASKARAEHLGTEVDVMHACGHDGHTAILMAVAEILAGLRDELAGTVAFYFQPAEEGPSDFVPDGTRAWGAKLMVQEGAMRAPQPSAVFGLHLVSGVPTGRIAYRSGAALASSDDLRVRIVGKQTHAGKPWAGIDPIVVSAQVILGLQTVISRQTDLSAAPTVVSLGTIHGGCRHNIIPEAVELTGTIRAYDRDVRAATQRNVARTVELIAAAGGARAEVALIEKYDPTVNDAALSERSRPSLEWAAHGDVVTAGLSSGAEDFSFLAQVAPGFFFFVGATPPNEDMSRAAPNHSPSFYVDEAALIIGARALAVLATDFLCDAEERYDNRIPPS